MNIDGLCLEEGNLEKASKLILAIQDLPDGTIEGLSEYDPSRLYSEEGKVVIKKPKLHGDPLTINFPEGSTKIVAKDGIISFEYKGRSYEIQQ